MPFLCTATVSSNDVEIPRDSTALTAEHIAAAQIFVQLCCKTEENGKKCVYKNDNGVTLASQRLKVVLDHKWFTDDVSKYLMMQLCTYLLMFELCTYLLMFFRLSMLTLEICLFVLRMIGTYLQHGGHHSC
jgi:hypothetical protein